RLGWPVPALPDPWELLAPLKPLVADADVVLINVEGAIGEGSAPPKCRPGSTRCYAFRQPPETAQALRELAPHASVVGNVANNHALDAGVAGWSTTSGHLEAVGAYVTGMDTLATLVPVRGALDTVAVLGFSTSQAGPDPRDLAAVRRHVERAATRTPRVVVTMHMGAEGVDAQRTANAAERYLGEARGNVVAFAHAAVEAGASLVVGHGPHVLRAAERRDGAVVFYSLGNLLTYGPFSHREPLNRGAIACVSIDPSGTATDVVLRPTVQAAPGRVSPDRQARGVWLVDSLSHLDFPATALRFSIQAVSRPPDLTQ
ncbi:MAG: CapA family protein, partial [Gemmatimonadales bacterium]